MSGRPGPLLPHGHIEGELVLPVRFEGRPHRQDDVTFSVAFGESRPEGDPPVPEQVSRLTSILSFDVVFDPDWVE